MAVVLSAVLWDETVAAVCLGTAGEDDNGRISGPCERAVSVFGPHGIVFWSEQFRGGMVGLDVRLPLPGALAGLDGTGGGFGIAGLGLAPDSGIRMRLEEGGFTGSSHWVKSTSNPLTASRHSA